MKIITASLLLLPFASLIAQETELEPKGLQRVVAIESVCAWPNLTLMPDGSLIAVLFNQPGHGTMQGDVDCYASTDGKTWSAPLRLAHSNISDCGYPASVQLVNGKIVTVYYSKEAPECDHYHMGVAVWEAPAP